MSRAFITDKEDWIYCPKAGERCMHAEEGKPCRETGCEFFSREIKPADHKSSAVKVVRRKPRKDANNANVPHAKAMAASGVDGKPGATPAGKPEPHRATKKANLKKPFKWGGRSGSNF